MQHSGGFREEKIMHESSVTQNRLGTNAREPRLEIGERQPRAIFPALREVAALPEGVSHLFDARGEMGLGDFPKTWKS